MERKIGLLRFFASSKASLPQGRQSTGLWACWRRYGLFSWLNRFVCMGFVFPFEAACGSARMEHDRQIETAIRRCNFYLTAEATSAPRGVFSSQAFTAPRGPLMMLGHGNHSGIEHVRRIALPPQCVAFV